MTELHFEVIPYVTVTAMSVGQARTFCRREFMFEPWKIVSMGQAVDGHRYRFGARTYRVFRDERGWRVYQRGLKETE